VKNGATAQAYPASFTSQAGCATYSDIEQQGRPTNIPKDKRTPSCATYIPAGNDKKYMRSDAIILLAGMENNANAKCCSSNLLWGNTHNSILLSQSYAGHNPVLLAEYASNPCTQSFDAYRNDQYTHTVENYRQVQQSWSDYPAGNISALEGLSVARMTQMIISDDPWNTHADKSPGMVAPPSLDRSVFGPNTRSIFDDAVAMAIPERSPAAALPEWQLLTMPASEQKATVLKTRRTTMKNMPYTP